MKRASTARAALVATFLLAGCAGESSSAPRGSTAGPVEQPGAVAENGTVADAGGAALRVETIELDEDGLLLDLQLLANGRGVAVGERGHATGNATLVLVTNDGGATWSRSTTPSGHRLYGVALQVDGGGVAAGFDGTLIRTTDHGRTWAAVERPRTPWYAGVADAGPGRFLVIGNEAAGPVLIVSDDAGATWADRSDALGASGSEEAPRAIAFRTPSDGWIVGQGGFATHTTDGGRSWTRVPTGVDAWLRGVHFIDADRGVIAGAQVVLRTDDGGRSWQTIDLPGTKLTSPRLLGPRHLLVTTMGGRLLESRDDGLTFTDAIPPVAPHHLVPIRPDPRGGVLVAGGGGRLFRLDD